MRQPTFFAHAWPRFDHQVYWSGSALSAAEHVDEAQLVEDPRQPRALLGQEARVLLVRAPVLEVDRLMRDVPVAAQDDLAPLSAQLQQVREERLEKAELGCLAMRAAEPEGK